MSNILIHMLVNPHSEYDIFSDTDFRKMSETFRSKNISCPNLGNRLWFQGLVSEISGSENTLTYFHEGMTKDYINGTFDMIVAPMANVFHRGFSDLLQRLAERFTGIRIPVYVIACGVQADSYNDLNELCSVIGPAARAFMKSVYDTGGEFALRGHFTKAFFERMGFPSAVVTGCPSLYQLGRNLRISEEKVPLQQFRPLINGDVEKYLVLARQHPDCEFFDQERFYHILHDPMHITNIRTLIRQHGFEKTRWLLAEKIKLIPHMNDWRNYLIESGFNFSFGSRIHGSIMPILSGIPAVITPQDARTREMAEFFGIPIIDANSVTKDTQLYDAYLQTDYSSFNKTFENKFDAYEHFMTSRGIVKKCNCNNKFFQTRPTNATAGNSAQLKQMNTAFLRQQWFWKVYDTALRWNRLQF